MALAYLCRQMELSAKPGVIAFTAFVVDHRARKESSQEARKVAGWVSKMGTCRVCFGFASLGHIVADVK